MFSKNLKYLRTKNNIEQLDLAIAFNRKSASTISEWESGKYTPKINVLSEIAKYFKVDIDDLMNKDLSTEGDSCMVKDNPNQTPTTTPISPILPLYNSLETPRQKKVVDYAKKQLREQMELEKHLMVNAAHERTDIIGTKEMKDHDNDIMDDKNF